MAEIVPFDPNVHMEEFYQMNVETATWHYEQLLVNYQIDIVSILGQTAQEYVDDNLEPYTSLKPPKGIIYLAVADGDVAGMIAVTKLSDDTGELHRMWNRRKFRGRGFGRQLLNKVLEAGREFGCSTFMLSTPKFAHAAQHLYRSAGFTERGEYPETEVPPDFRSYWIYMEKK